MELMIFVAVLIVFAVTAPRYGQDSRPTLG